MPAGKEFIKHEFDEAISIQKTLVESARELSQAHPVPAARTALQEMLPEGEAHLEALQSFGALFGARGKKEVVVRGMAGLMEKTLANAKEHKEEESEAYEAHAVLLSLKRKQQDSSVSLIRIAEELGDRKLATAARKMQRELSASSKKLNDLLADFAVRIAKQETQP
jgi:hypothetical protein